MSDGDFFSTEQSYVVGDSPDSVKIELVGEDGSVLETLKPITQLLPYEVIDGSVMRIQKLREFYEAEIGNTEDGVLFSLHLKATMMKVGFLALFSIRGEGVMGTMCSCQHGSWARQGGPGPRSST